VSGSAGPSYGDAAKGFSGAKDYDIIHFHTDCLHFSMARVCRTPHVTTLHGRLDLPDPKLLYREFSEMPVISISDSQLPDYIDYVNISNLAVDFFFVVMILPVDTNCRNRSGAEGKAIRKQSG
jgi:hypothetical protein